MMPDKVYWENNIVVYRFDDAAPESKINGDIYGKQWSPRITKTCTNRSLQGNILKYYSNNTTLVCFPMLTCKIVQNLRQLIVLLSVQFEVFIYFLYAISNII